MTLFIPIFRRKLHSSLIPTTMTNSSLGSQLCCHLPGFSTARANTSPAVPASPRLSKQGLNHPVSRGQEGPVSADCRAGHYHGGSVSPTEGQQEDWVSHTYMRSLCRGQGANILPINEKLCCQQVRGTDQRLCGGEDYHTWHKGGTVALCPQHRPEWHLLDVAEDKAHRLGGLAL